MEIKFGKVVNEKTKECQVGLGNNADYYKSIGMSLLEVEQAYNGLWYFAGYAPEQDPKEAAQEEINRLEKLQTPRLYREAIAGGEYAINKLAEIDALIAVQRAIINPPVAEETEEVEGNA